MQQKLPIRPSIAFIAMRIVLFLLTKKSSAQSLSPTVWIVIFAKTVLIRCFRIKTKTVRISLSFSSELTSSISVAGTSFTSILAL